MGANAEAGVIVTRGHASSTGRLLLLAAGLAVFSGCSIQPPTVAHVHVGHSITAWRDTPNENGLLVTAELAADRLVSESRKAEEQCDDLPKVRKTTTKIIGLVEPSVTYSGKPGQQYGLKRAIQGTVDHLGFAVESDDASDNLRRWIPEITERADEIVERTDEILVLGPALYSSRSTEESCAIAGEIHSVADTIVDGSPSQAYGLVQLRQDIVDMIGEERPRYKTVDSWYLLNIVRLPNGRWDFVQRKDDAGGGGNGGSGY